MPYYLFIQSLALSCSGASSTETLARQIYVNMLTGHSSYFCFQPHFLGTQKLHKHTVYLLVPNC